MRPRAPDGRFAPQTGDIQLPPREKAARDEHGRFLPSSRVVSSKPYSKAVRELLDHPGKGLPVGWNGENLSAAQDLALVHMAMARAGNVQIGMVIIDRAEGKVPQAAEDREAAVKAGTGIRLLAELLGLKDVTDSEEVKDAQIAAAPAGETEDSQVPLLGDPTAEAVSGDESGPPELETPSRYGSS